jgi:hypothetical protein
MLIAARENKNTERFCEDLVTSSVFEPLCYMTVPEVWSFFRKLLPPDAINQLSYDPIQVKFDFWPNLIQMGGINRERTRVEPDLIVRFYNHLDSILTFMFELKWDARLNPKEELYNQWTSLPEKLKGGCFHIYLVKSKENRHNEIPDSLGNYPENSAEKAMWEKRLIFREWKEIYKLLKELIEDNTSSNNISYWASNLSAFLKNKKLAFHEFDGFKKLGTPNIFEQKEIFFPEKPFLTDKIFKQSVLISDGYVFYNDLFWQSASYPDVKANSLDTLFFALN